MWVRGGSACTRPALTDTTPSCLWSTPSTRRNGLADQHQPVALEVLRGHDHVGDTRLVLQAEKEEALGRSRALAHDDTAGHSDRLARPPADEIAGAGHSLADQLRPAQGHGMAADGYTGPRIVGLQALDLGHLRKR